MSSNPKKVFVQFGTENIPVDTISACSLDKNIETAAQKAKRKKDDVGFSTFSGGWLGSVAAAPAVVAATVLFTSGVPALAVLAGGAAIGSVIGNRKGEKKFNDNKKNDSLDHSVLKIDLIDGKRLSFCADDCGFNIYDKYKELNEKLEQKRTEEKRRRAEEKRRQEIISKLSNSENQGEYRVDYAIKWCIADLNADVISVERNCESKYRYGCILLGKPDFIDEPQEYDHILVCDVGVIIIETKHWKGRVEIRPDGKWLRDSNNDGHVVGIESPVFQMRRHEALMQRILPQVPIFSLLCFSNDSVILEGRENFTDYPIVYVDQLRGALSTILAAEKNPNNSTGSVVKEIEKHKINIIDIGEIERYQINKAQIER